MAVLVVGVAGAFGARGASADLFTISDQASCLALIPGASWSEGFPSVCRIPAGGTLTCPGGSLASKVKIAIADLAAGDTRAAQGALTGFINEVNAQAGKKIGQAQAAQLVAAARQIQNVIG